MAIAVSVESMAVQSGIACCRTAIHELQDASNELMKGYQQAGSSGWRDQKYAALSGIVEECCSSLNNPISQLEECIGKLEEILSAVNDYEQTSI